MLENFPDSSLFYSHLDSFFLLFSLFFLFFTSGYKKPPPLPLLKNPQVIQGMERDPGFRNCTKQIHTMHGVLTSITFDNEGIPSIPGMKLLCYRTIEEAEEDGEAWIAEATALNILGFKIFEFNNGILIFSFD